MWWEVHGGLYSCDRKMVDVSWAREKREIVGSLPADFSDCSVFVLTGDFAFSVSLFLCLCPVPFGATLMFQE